MGGAEELVGSAGIKDCEKCLIASSTSLVLGPNGDESEADPVEVVGLVGLVKSDGARMRRSWWYDCERDDYTDRGMRD